MLCFCAAEHVAAACHVCTLSTPNLWTDVLCNKINSTGTFDTAIGAFEHLQISQGKSNLLPKELYCCHEETWLNKSWYSCLIEEKIWPGVNWVLSVHYGRFVNLNNICSLKHVQQCLLVFCGFLSDRFLFRFNKPNKSMLPFVVFFQVFGGVGADVLTKCNASFDFLLWGDTINV